MAKAQSSYRLFQATLYPVLPYLLYSAQKVKSNFPTPDALSEELLISSPIPEVSKLLILGESTAAGVGAKSTEETLANHFYRLFDQQHTIFNLGKNGIRAKELWPYFHRKLEKEQGEISGILLFIGANDCFKLTSPSDFSLALQRLIEALKSKFNPDWFYLADIPPVQDFPAFPPVLKYYLKNQRKFLCQEMETLAASDPQIIFKKISLSLDSDFFCEDLVHPSGKGYQAIAKFSFDSISKSGLKKSSVSYRPN